MSLYYIHDDGETPEPGEYDLFVRAADVQAAIKSWQRYYETQRKPDNIDEIPEQSADGAIPWDAIPLVYVGPRVTQRAVRRTNK